MKFTKSCEFGAFDVMRVWSLIFHASIVNPRSHATMVLFMSMRVWFFFVHASLASQTPCEFQPSEYGPDPCYFGSAFCLATFSQFYFRKFRPVRLGSQGHQVW